MPEEIRKGHFGHVDGRARAHGNPDGEEKDHGDGGD
jgi:hypothetical protein